MAYKKTIVIEDANIWLSFLIGSKYNDLLAILKDPNYKIVYCEELIKELYNSLKHPKFAKYFTKQDVSKLARTIKTFAHKAEIRPPYPKITRDPKDDYIIELAVSTKADHIVTNDNDLLTINKHQNTQIVSLATFATKYYQQKAVQYARKAKEFERIAKKETKKFSGRHM